MLYFLECGRGSESYNNTRTLRIRSIHRNTPRSEDLRQRGNRWRWPSSEGKMDCFPIRNATRLQTLAVNRTAAEMHPHLSDEYRMDPGPWLSHFQRGFEYSAAISTSSSFRDRGRLQRQTSEVSVSTLPTPAIQGELFFSRGSDHCRSPGSRYKLARVLGWGHPIYN